MRDQEQITYFASYDYRGKQQKFGVRAKDRSQHVYVIGKTGMGKSTLLENMAIQDIQNGNGMAFIDPHGSTAEKLLDYVPEDRIQDVIYFAPFDLEYPISFNVMEDVGYDRRHLVVNNLMSAFKKIWVDAWSARMEYLLTNALLALVEYPGSTLLSVNRMFIDKTFRKKVLEHVTDPVVKSFWEDEFTKYTDRYTQEATPAIQNKIGQFLSNPLVRNIVGQPTSSFDVREVMDSRKILVMNLSKGRMGDVNARLLGSMLIIKIYLGAMSRADANAQELQKLPHFYFYVDEFQSFANETFADILSEARKYKLALTIAHQYVGQMSEEVRDAIFGNVGTMITFRIGAEDAETLEKEFAPTFSVEDMVSLGAYQIYLKLMIDGITSRPFSAKTMPPIATPEHTFREQIVDHSRKTYAKERSTVEEAIRDSRQTDIPSAAPEEREAASKKKTTPQRDHKPKSESRPQDKDTRERSRETERKPREERPERQHQEKARRDDRKQDRQPKTEETTHQPFAGALSQMQQGGGPDKEKEASASPQEAVVEKSGDSKQEQSQKETAAPKEREAGSAEEQKSVSLKHLKKRTQREEKSPEHVAALRSALSEALAQHKQTPQDTPTPESKQVEPAAPQEQEASEEKPTKETGHPPKERAEQSDKQPQDTKEDSPKEQAKDRSPHEDTGSTEEAKDQPQARQRRGRRGGRRRNAPHANRASETEQGEALHDSERRPRRPAAEIPEDQLKNMLRVDEDTGSREE